MGVSSKAAIPGNKPAPNGNKPVPKAIDGFEYVTQSKAAIPGNKPAPNGNKPVPKAIDGFEYVTQSPPNNEIDRSQTTREMVLKQRAVLKGGRKVTWAKNPT